MAYSNIQIGEQNNNIGAPGVNQRGGRQGDTMVSKIHGDHYEQTLNGRIWSFGISNTALVAANAIATGLTATAQLIIGVYNPINSGKNMEILQAIVNTTTIANTAVSPGGFMWVYSAGNSNAITVGSAPINNKTLTTAGPDGASSVGKAYSVSTALTGLTNNLAALHSTAMNSINAAGPATAIHQPTNNPLELVNGILICPPGGVLGIMCQVSTTTINVSTAIKWAEVAV